MTKEPKTRQSKGGEARAAALDPSRRSQIARDAAKARWRHRDGQALEDEMIGSVEGAPAPFSLEQLAAIRDRFSLDNDPDGLAIAQRAADLIAYLSGGE